MKWMIASDIHGSAYYCRKLLEAYTEEGADRLLLLGDILYHGPRNDLPRDYAPKEGTQAIYATHGHIYNEQKLPPLHSGDILLHGHTHVPKCVVHETEQYICMNPGSVSIPKEESWHGYMIWEGKNFVWKDFDGQEHLRYSV